MDTEPLATEGVLDSLRDAGAHATFFVLGRRAHAHPKLLAEIIAGGHEIALHGPDHRALTSFTSARSSAEQPMHGTDSASWLELDPVDPEYGRQTLTSFYAVRKAGLEPVMWSASLLDAAETTSTMRLENVTRACARAPSFWRTMVEQMLTMASMIHRYHCSTEGG